MILQASYVGFMKNLQSYGLEIKAHRYFSFSFLHILWGPITYQVNIRDMGLSSKEV